MSRRQLVAPVLILVGVALAIALTTAATPSPTPTDTNFFAEVSNSHLADTGIVLSPPDPTEAALTTSRAAEQAALRVMSRQSIRRTVLLNVHFTVSPRPDCLCWVISMWPPGGLTLSSGPAPASGARVSATGHLIFRLAFVRADTGAFVLLVEEGTRT